MKALAASDVTSDRQLAEDIKMFLLQSPHLKKVLQLRQRQVVPTARHAIERTPQSTVTKRRPDPKIER